MKPFLQIAAAALALSSAAAYASSPAFIGWTEPTSVSCFTRTSAAGGGSGVRNQCTTTQTWFIPFHIASSGSKAPSVLASRTSASASVCCSATAIDGNGNRTATTASRCIPSGSLLSRIALSSISVPSYGTLFLTCSVSSGSSVISATY